MLKTRKAFLIFAWTTAGLSLVYLILKAFLMPLFGDEAATFYFYALPFEINPLTAHADANNHPLNSFLTAIFYQLFGSAKGVLRIGSLLAFPLYALYSGKISLRQELSSYRWLMFVALIFSHNLIEFFSVSRGYGMSMAFLLMAYYHLSALQQKAKTKDMLWLWVALSLMLSSNLSLMLVYLMGGALAILSLVWQFKQWKKALIFLVLYALPLIIFLRVSFYFRDLGLLYYGSLDGFWQVTVKSVLALLFNQYYLPIALVFTVLFAWTLILYLQKAIQLGFKNFLLSPIFTSGHWLFGNIIAVLIMGYLLKINFPEDRVGLHLYLLFILAFFEFIKHNKIKALQWLPWIVLLLPMHYFWQANTKVTVCYYDDYLPEKFYQSIAKDAQGTVPLVGTYRTKAMGWHYQNYRFQGGIPYVFWTHFPDTISDYVIAKVDKNPLYQKAYTILSSENINGRSVLKRKKPLQRELIYDSKNTLFTGKTNQEFIPIWELLGDSLNDEHLLLEYKLKLSCENIIREAWLVASANDSLFNPTQYEYTPLYRAQPYFREAKFHSVMAFYNTPKESTRKVSYIWNLAKEEVTVHENQLKIYRLK